MNDKLPTLALGIGNKPTWEMVVSAYKEAESYPPGRYRMAWIKEAKRLEKRIKEIDDLDKGRAKING